MPPGTAPGLRPGEAGYVPPPALNRKVAVLVPLTGPNASLGHDLLQAVQLALGPDGPQPDVRDTMGTPTGATAATQAAMTNGDAIIIGPLTAPETAAAAAVVNGAVPILAFTSDRQQGRPGVWAMGITPQQQVARLVQALSTTGKARIGAVLPDNIFGNALADGLSRAASSAGDPPPAVKRYPTGRVADLQAALKDVSDYAHRRGAIDEQVRAARADSDPTIQGQADVLAQQTVPPAPIDALLLAETGPTLKTVAGVLPSYDITPPEVQVIGPATWARDAANLVGLDGAWYAAPDPASRTGFEQSYRARFGSPPPGFADIAYDAGRLARIAAGNPGILTQPSGFNGVDGPFVLTAAGQVGRGLAVFAVSPGGNRLIFPSPPSAAPGS